MRRTRVAMTGGILLVLAAAVAVGVGMVSRLGAQQTFAPDRYEPDNTTSTARVLGNTTTHTFHDDTDTDWMRFTATTPGRRFVFETIPLAGEEINPELTVHRQFDGSLEPIDGNDDSAVWPNTLGSTLSFEATAAGTYYLEVSQAVAGGVGRYRLFWEDGRARRVGGVDRYQTAALISQLQWSNTGVESWGTSCGPDAVVLATGQNFPDALASSVLAAGNDTTLLLAKRSSLPAYTVDEIRRLARSRAQGGHPIDVYVIGGTAAIGQQVVNQLNAMPEVGSVLRLAGDDRYETAERVAYEVRNSAGTEGTAFICGGGAFPDAIAGAPVAATSGSVMLLVRRNSVPMATQRALQALGITRCYILGGTAAVSSDVADTLEIITGTPPVRLGGSDRYATSRIVAQYGVDNFAMDGGCVQLATGQKYPDALAATCMSWWNDGPTLLTRTNSLPGSVTQFLDDNSPPTSSSYVLGGASAVSDAVFQQFREHY